MSNIEEGSATVPEYLEVVQGKVILSRNGASYEIKKPSALKLLDIHEAGKSIDAEKELRKLIEFKISSLVSLGLPKEIAEELDLNELMATFNALTADPVKKK